MDIKLDHIDLSILKALQIDAALSQRDLADRLGLSQNACWRRVRRLKQAGVLRAPAARVDAAALGLDLAVFMLVRTRHHDAAWAARFRSRVESLPEVMELHRIGGEWDYLIKVLTTGMRGYDRVYQRLIEDLDIEKVTGLFSMEQILTDRPVAVPQGR
ncbi:winged helix-turn-helix transcriptional regulator [Rhodobacteraceae bacterium 2CG4]|uniref:Winged helix-turn-helix transcriptional regulator n=1 Tax=Halovulum marinum TaxID=2662447 RepID=A0A6L5YVU9_9RHOB|nr:Lrp/AsnC family transcriptional regulator [Halovulum marinum]MSU88039.1 winged helix-turn-helix transcriptional regulator [Halovulum marinum]